MNEFGIVRKSAVKKIDTTNIWSTEKINQYIRNEQIGVRNNGPSPFFEDNYKHKKSGLVFEHTFEELEEIKKCMADVEYFADKYCFAMTDHGSEKIQLYDYQRDALRCFQDNRYVLWTASRQIGKCCLCLTKINVKQGSIRREEQLNLNKLYSRYAKLTFLRKIKNFLYNVLDKLNI